MGSSVGRGKIVLAFLICILLLPSAAFGCKYTVRDVGFVDIGSTPYQLYLFTGKDTPEEQEKVLKEISYVALMEANVMAEVVNVDRGGDHPAMRYFRFWHITHLPAAVLVSPEDGRSLFLPLHGRGKTFKGSVWNVMEGIVSSPVREEILKHIVRAYCIVLFVLGGETQANKRAEKAISEATGEIRRMMSQFPKSVDEPPHLITISPDSFAEERILLWSLGIDEGSGEPHVAVLYGRGRRIGPVLKGGGITASGLFNILSAVGQACECGLDRGWILGRMIPLKWDEEVQTEVVKILGFDAENPMVKAEVGQILAIGSTSNGEEESQDLFYGYEEREVEYDNVSSVAMLSPAQVSDMTYQRVDPHGGGSVLRTIILPLIGISTLILIAAAFIILRTRRREV